MSQERAMVRTGQDVTDAELSVLRVLWKCGACTIRQITEQVYPNNSESDYATVKKLLSRLEKKQFVLRRRDNAAHQFEAIVSVDDLVGRRLRELADNLCGGSSTPLLMHLLSHDDITPQQQKKLRDLIDQMAKSKSKKRKTRGKTND